MPIELKVPTVGESITEVLISEWLKKEGDTVAEGEPLVVIETDKVNVELPAPQAGTLVKIVKGNGENAVVGETVGLFETRAASGGAGAKGGKQDAPAEAAEAPAGPPPAAAVPAPDPAKGAETAPAEGVAPESEPAVDPETPTKAGAAGDATPAQAGAAKAGAAVVVMPAAARVMAQEGVAAAEVEGTGKGGRILKEDVVRQVEARAAAPAPAAAPAKPVAPAPQPAASGDPSRQEEVVPMTPLRKRVAERLVEAQQNAAMLTTFNEIDMSATMELRKKYQEAFLAKYGIKLGFMSFFVRAAVEALKEVPQVNASVSGTSIVYHNYQDIGVAVGGGKGLVVPIIRNAERMGFAELEKKIAEYADKAKNSKLTLEELQGGTFTISNGGIYGSLLSTPILNPPQSGILGLHKIEERPIALAGQVVIRPMMYVALTYDHRIIDGREAVTFLVRLKERIEDPARLLLEV
jgi:2-oxoglutarate dehydrogenase E2 component (dihydrolipoamide succinyltransferase)